MKSPPVHPLGDLPLPAPESLTGLQRIDKPLCALRGSGHLDLSGARDSSELERYMPTP